MSMTSIDITQDELRILKNLLTQIKCSLEDAALFLPILDKIDRSIMPEEPAKTHWEDKK